MSGNFPRLPSPYWGGEMIWNSQTSVHNPIARSGRACVDDVAASANRETPAFCRKARITVREALSDGGGGSPGSRLRSQSKQLTHIDTCFTTHHLIFAEDKNNTLWLSGGGARQPVIG